MMDKIHINFRYLLLVIVVATTSCSDKEHKYHSVFDRIDAEQKNYVEYTRIDEIDSLEFIKVHPDNYDFLITKRTSKIVSYKCTECHTQDLKELQKGVKENQKKAHWDIKLSHADINVMDCTTCHTDNNMNQLHSINGKSISFDKSYNLCGQCHSPQLKDWKGGAHGKQVDGWKKPRISKTCTDCHNPHDPSFKQRWPSRLVEKPMNK